MEFDIKTIGLVVSGGFILLQWLSKRHIDSSKTNRESLAQISELFMENIKDMSAQKKFLVEEALSGYYRKNIYIHELLLLINAKSPKSAIENYLKYKRYLKIENGRVKYRKNPFTKIPFTNFKFPTMVLKGIIMYIFFAIIGGVLLQNLIPELIAFDSSQLKINGALSITNMLSKFGLVMLGIICIMVAITILHDSFSIPSKTVLEEGLEGVFDDS